MKIKKSLLIVMMLILSVFISACDFTNTSKITSTDENIYNYYCDILLETQNNIGNDINKISLNNENKNRINTAINLVSISSREELAVISGIECYNLVSSPKEIYLDVDDGRIFVKQQGRNYVVVITVNNISYTYELSIAKDSTTNEYTINYEKTINNQNYLCTAKVLYDMAQSHLMVKIQTYNDITSERFESYKDCFSLINSNKALRINILQGETNNRSVYVIDTYKQIINFKTKVASCNALSGDIDINDINNNTFITSQASDICGFILEYNADTQNPTINSFGELSNW